MCESEYFKAFNFIDNVRKPYIGSAWEPFPSNQELLRFFKIIFSFTITFMNFGKLLL